MKSIMICKIKYIYKKYFHKEGFTLIETLMSIFLFTVVMLAINVFFISIYKEQAVDIAKIQSIEKASRTIELMSSEIRKINRAENGAFFIELADSQTFIFYSDIDNDSLNEKVQYNLNGETFEKIVIQPGVLSDYTGPEEVSIITDNVKNGSEAIFTYFDQDYTGNESFLASPVNVTLIRIIGISLDIDAGIGTSSGIAHMETKIHPRNIKNIN